MRISSTLCALLIGAATLSLAACDQPKWRDKSKPRPGTPVPPAARTIPSDPAGVPAAPEWAKAIIGQKLRDAYPNTAACQGNTDLVQKTYAGDPPGVQGHGWGWDTAKAAPVERVILVNKDAVIVGAGAGGAPRPDVPTALPAIKSPDTGWYADAPVTIGPLDTYGVVGPDTVCVLGRLEF